MDYNIISKYIKLLSREYLNFFKIIFANSYSKELCSQFIDTYINVRYYNETNYRKEKDFIQRLNKDLLSLYDKLATEENENKLKNIIALFGYIIYFDDIDYFVYERELIKALIEDENIKIYSKGKVEEDIVKWYLNLKKLKESFNEAIVSKEFSLVEKRVYRNTIRLDLDQEVKISNLYSEYAINKAFNMGNTYEQRLFITYIMASALVLENAKGLNFSKHYIVDFAKGLYKKEKKFKRIFNILDNPLTKKYISVMISYQDYLENNKVINEKITEGYSFGVMLDSKFNGDIENLIIFSYVFMHEDYEMYDLIMENKDNIKAKIIVV